MRVLAILIIAACGSKSPAPKPVATNAELSPALSSLAWWLGDWQAEENATGSEHWVAASGAIYGIALQDNAFEVMIVDDGEGGGKADGVLRFFAMPGGAKSVEFRQRQLQAGTITFANDQHDYPKAITYTREDDQLRAEISGGDRSDRYRWRRILAPPARELEEADLAFAKATAARGIEGWVAAFEPNGGMMAKAGLASGHDAIRDLMKPLLDTTKVEWAPIASAKRGDLGYTVGKATFTGKDSWRSTYVTIWKKQLDGTWKVLFDTGRTVNAE